ncbi:RES family NAD+ phosphorylase [Erythrobacter sp. MTPC3]|uniref:RES family NAD+ phosphorylase n=1 Tax=Erythrobacter sp. MTPC3 TaxID=3056564 RepID=UPI0036F319F3
MRYKGALYRALNPRYAKEPLSGAGAEKYGGRFNRIGRATLYTALKPEHALREANQIGALQPTTLVSYQANLDPVFDATDVRAMKKYSMSPSLLSSEDWRDNMLVGRTVPTHDFAECLIADGYVGMLVPSYAKANADGVNLVLWEWSGHLRLVDDEGRLTRRGS